MQNVKRKTTVPPLYLIRNERLTPPPHLLAGERVVLFDGECVLCRRLVQTLIRADWKKKIHLATVQSRPGKDLLRWAGLSDENFNTIAYIADGQVSIRSDAFFQALIQLGWPWRTLRILRFLPRKPRDGLYNYVARNRYRWFGKLPGGTLPPDDGQGRRYLDGGRG
ncbi:DCC1-like thiol-disulfide oxidoreductase family protein [Sodalis sp. dw_96]|uniref:thiol-disulfide oxidoreductase DCC family protein n=1 Tax=Sodalis sp. dw_96 TaxID=2719794 RepID=UPI001BD2D37D|nr:DCC1-like thiol-disulfide oxidoreductase family protein [Sodalis sp. dw_96]